MTVSLGALLATPPALAQIEFDPVATGLIQPVFATPAPDGSDRLFIVEQPGRILIVDSGGVRAIPFLDIRTEVLSGGERGLLGLAFHPQFSSNRRFFVYYTRSLDGQTQSVVAEYSVSASNPDAADPQGRVLLSFAQPFPNHNAGWIGFGPDGYLYIASGDGGSGGDPFNNGQNLDTLLGKILRIDVDSGQPYSIPFSNPFTSDRGRREIWAYGLRNPFRCAFDFVTGRLFAGDVGQSRWEEVDIIERAGNYGWNITEGPDCYPPTVANCDRAGQTAPIHAYGRGDGASVIGGRVFRGPGNPALEGRYIFGDFVSGRIWSLTESGPGDWTRELLSDSGFSISAFGEDATGRLLVVDYRGTVWRLADQPAPDLAVTKTAPGPLVAGTRAAYRIDVSNQGALDADGEALLLDPLPAGLAFVSAAGDDWSCQETPDAVRCTRSTPIVAGTTSTVLLTVDVSSEASATLTNTATVTHPRDTDPQNDSDSVETAVLPRSRVPIHYPQLAIGGEFTAVLLLSETAGAPWNGNIRLRQGNDEDWSTPWSVNGEDRSGAPGLAVSLAANEAARFVFRGDGQAREGYLEIVPDDGFSSLDLTGNLFYQLRDPAGGLLDSTGTPSDLPGSLFALPVEHGAGIETGFAISPYSASPPFEVRLTLLDQNGVQVGRRSVPFTGHLADFVSEYFVGLEEGFVGTLRIESDSGVYLAALRVESARQGFQLTSVPPRRLR